jgi:polyisoprenyl-phosphate glycosyltransferase
MPRPTLSVVIPFLDEEEVIPELHKRLRKMLAKVGVTWEVVFVDDGSIDRSLELVRELCAKESRYKVISLSRNFGHQVAVTAGIDHAAGDAVVVMDADLQDPPEVVSEMLARWREGYDVVYGVRSKREGEGIFKRATAAVFYRLMRLMVGIELPLDTGDFRLQSRRVVLALRALRETHRFVRGFVVWVGFKQTAVHYVRPGRHAGTTKYPLGKMFRFAVDAITSFSIIPLRISSFLGVLSGFAAVGLALWAVWERYFGEGIVPGWTSTVFVVSLVSAAQLLMIGILGEYVGRIYEEVKRRPLYVVGDRYNFNPAKRAKARPRRDEASPSPPAEE